MEQKPRWFSYRSLFRFSPVLYRMGADARLPVPVKIETVVVFLFLAVMFYPLCWLLEPLTVRLLHMGKWMVDIIVAGTVAWAFTGVDPAGKFLPVYIWDIIAFCTKRRQRVGSALPVERRRIENSRVTMLD